MGFAVSLIVFTVGAILRFATNVRSSTFNIQTVGDILMIVGVVGFVLAGLAWAYWDGFGTSTRRRRVYRQASSAPPVYGPDGYARTTYNSGLPVAPGAVAPGVVAPGTPGYVEPTRPARTVVQEEERSAF